MSKHIQGSAEWLEYRRNHIGASDAPVIMGDSPWTTPYQLWCEKIGRSPGRVATAAMQRGLEMEGKARISFEDLTGFDVFPQVLEHPEHSFMMASFDGLTLDGSHGVEIKCPGVKAHELALKGEVPKHYVAQLQHQMSCSGLDKIFYYSYRDESDALIEVDRDDEYISKLIEKEKLFWQLIQEKEAPSLTDKDYINIEAPSWKKISKRLFEIDHDLKVLEKERKFLKEKLISDAGECNCRGHGITLRRTYFKGGIDYGSIPELANVDLNVYRKKGTESWILRLNNKDKP